jgi:sialate O-acetylesterase
MLRHLLSCVMLLVVTLCRADDALPLLHPLFQDHMVLQRGIADPIWGWAAPGTKVTVTMLGKTVTATANAQGAWQTKIGPFTAGGPYTLTVEGAQKITLQDVLVGDVWLCSGQSNMEMGLGLVHNASEEIKSANYPHMRLFTVQKKVGYAPQRLLRGSKWDPCTPETVAANGWGGFSATGYFFGRALLLNQKVPIGLIHSAWSGTVAEAWVSGEALKTMADFKPAVEKVQRFAESVKDKPFDYAKALQAWWAKSDAGSLPGVNWADPAFDATAWKSMPVPTFWEDAGLPEFDGLVWYRTVVTIPEAWAGRELLLQLGPIDDGDTTWFNGTVVGSIAEGHLRNREYQIPGKLVTAGQAVLAVRVLDLGGSGGLYGKPEQMTLRRVDDPAQSISLAGAWQFAVGADFATGEPIPQRMDSNANQVSALYNAMIAPLLPFGIKGAIWYQGESNAGNAKQYQTLLPTLIKDWRTRFGVGDFPFLIVSLANFMAVQTSPVESGWAELREAQWLTAHTLPKTGIAMAIDIGNAADIHPKNKQEVGRRLALAAEAIAYGQQIPYSGPMYKRMKIEGQAIRLSFDHLSGGLVAKDGGKLTGFAIAGADRKFVFAEAIIDGKTIVVSSPAIAAPVAVRYAWANNPLCNLYNTAGLPAVPFRTDR